MGMGALSKPQAVSLASLGVAVLVVSFPAWTGSWIYDDWSMSRNPLMDDAGDLWRVFSRSSTDYLGWTPGREVAGSTYRPLSMFSLIAVQALFGRTPLPHHLLSVAMHLACVALLVRSVGGALAGAWASRSAACLRCIRSASRHGAGSMVAPTCRCVWARRC
jgi:hypothetical protein